MKGSYILVVFINREIKPIIGALGKIKFQKGFYLYIGSAMGTSGSATLISRIRRHISPPERKKTHWHIDYLLNNKYSLVCCVYLIPSHQNLECFIVNEILNVSDGHIDKFGSSDCLCKSHLLYFEDFKSLKKRFQKLAQYQL